jgi:hypothetical protein
VLEAQKPLSQWETFQSFDTAAQCKAAQHKMGLFLDAEIARHLKDSQNESQKDQANDLDLWMLRSQQGKVNLSKCIATDDPRLAKPQDDGTR